jgi:hypothetical protein
VGGLGSLTGLGGLMGLGGLNVTRVTGQVTGTGTGGLNRTRQGSVLVCH